MNTAELPLVTVIIPMYNERTHIRECLDSLMAQDYPAERLQILVVDGMSDDGSREIVRAFAGERASGRIALLDNPKRIPAAAMNVGLRAARGDVIVRLDAHSFAAEDFISQSVAHLARSGAACVGGTIASSARTRLGRAIALAMSSPFGVGNALFRYAQKEQYVDTVAFGAYPRAVFEALGPFDEQLIYSEDNEFNHRLRQRGGKILLTPAIRSFYYTRESLGGLWRQYYHYGLGRVPFMLRSPDSIMLRHLAPFALVSALLLGAVGGVFFAPLRWLLLAVVCSYLAAALLFAARISAKHGWRHFFILPAAFACMHVGYGVGMYAGLVRVVARRIKGER